MRYQISLFCEVDRCASVSYCAIHGAEPDLNIGDIAAADEKAAPDFNVMFGGSPCQDFSVAGKQGGAVWTCLSCGHAYDPLTVHYTQRGRCPSCGSDAIEKTRSSLLTEWLRFLREKKPRFAIYENVKNFVSHRFRGTFDRFVAEAEEYGYHVYCAVLDAKDYGVPQTRSRVYCVMIRGDLDNFKFAFPPPIPLRRTLSDYLDDDVNEKYYLSDDKVAEMALLNESQEEVLSGSRVRRLTPRETWRLMGFSDEDFERARDALQREIYNGRDRCSEQLYKQAGNSVVVDVLLHIMESLYLSIPSLFDHMIVGSFFSGIGAFETALDRLMPAEWAELNQIGYINGYNGDANRVYDSAGLCRTLKGDAGRGGAKTGWYLVPACPAPHRKITDPP